MSARLKSATFWLGAAGVIILVAAGIEQTARVGFARALAAQGSLTALDRALRISPEDPASFEERARFLMARSQFTLAIADLQRAISLRKDDYTLWMLLGESFEHDRDTTHALAATLEARRLAPSYGNVNWQTATLLLELGRREEAFKEFRAATLRLPELFPRAVELAWDSYGHDADAVVIAVSAVSLRERLQLAQFFLRNGETAAASALLTDRNDLTGDDRRQLVRAFFNVQAFPEAFAIWSEGLGKHTSGSPERYVYDGGFENGRFTGDTSFGWNLNDTPTARAFFDRAEAHSGSYSMRVDWNGNSPSGEDLLSQLLIVDPQVHYRLNFAVKTLNLVSAAIPSITVSEAGKENRTLASALLSGGTSNWEDHSVEFTTGRGTSAVRIAVRRGDCKQAPCSIVGSLWLDDFSLEALPAHQVSAQRRAQDIAAK